MTNFESLNEDIIGGEVIQKGFAVALDGKKVITDHNELPFQYDATGAPIFHGKKVRLDVVPCKKLCRTCPNGYLKNLHNNFCLWGNACPWPLEAIVRDGQTACHDPNPGAFKANIQIKQPRTIDPQYLLNPRKEAAKKNEKDLVAVTNRDNLAGIILTYEWSVYSVTQQAAALPPGSRRA